MDIRKLCIEVHKLCIEVQKLCVEVQMLCTEVQKYVYIWSPNMYQYVYIYEVQK